MRRTLHQPAYIALVGVTLSVWAGAAAVRGGEGYGVAAAAAFFMTVSAVLPTFRTSSQRIRSSPRTA